MKLTRLIYASVATPGIEFSELQDILFTSEKNNVTKEITGALSYGRGSFLQLLEGERSEISALYQTISLDTRHSQLELLEVVPIQTRDFAQWSMRYVPYNEEKNVAVLAKVKKIMHGDDFTPKLWSAEQSRAVLIALNTEI
jgi:hypothetical protein